MSKTVTFTVDTKYQDTIQETFTYTQIGLDEHQHNGEINEEIEKIFNNWLWHQLNISYSIVIANNND